VFSYDAEGSGVLHCPSCNPSKARPTAVFDQRVTHEGQGLLVDRPYNYLGQWVAADIPGWSGVNATARYQSRYLTESGRVFFNAVDPLVEGDTNGKMDVYQFEPAGEGSCASSTGCVALITGGKSTQESAFLDASTSGNDVFVLSSQQLLEQDKDSGFDVYDARVCSESSPCLGPPPGPTPPCADEAQCKGGYAGVPALPGVPLTAAVSGPGNAGSVRVLGVTTTGKPTSKPLTRAQKLKRALKKCKKIKKHKKRQACIRKANKLYGAKKHKGKAGATHGGGQR
jgi:hypothetical protein